MSSRTALYRFYDADDQLLYVGITEDIATRWDYHASKKPWWADVDRKTVQWYEGWREASCAEVRAIVEEAPLHNVVHAPGRHNHDRSGSSSIKLAHGPAPAAPLHALVLATLAEQGRSQNWLHKRTGVSRNTIASWKTQPRPPQAGTVLTIADALGIDRGEALRLAGVMDDASAARTGTAPDLSEIPTDALVEELHRIGDELRRRIPG